MRRQVTVGGLVALALLSGSMVAFAQPPAPADCAPAGVERARLVPDAPAQDDPEEDAGEEPDAGDEPDEDAGDEPDEDAGDEPDEDAGDEPEEPDDSAEEPSDDEPADDAPADDAPADDAPADDAPADDAPADDAPADDAPADDAPADDGGAAGDEPTEEPADGGEPSEPTSDEPADGVGPTDADEPAATDPAEQPADEPDGECVPAADATAATTLGWGAPTREDGFDGPLDPAWEVYTGAGFDGRGTRTADALTTENGVLTITGSPEGATGGLAWGPGQTHGRWEARVRTPASDPTYNALLLLWPDDASGNGSEIDFMEMLDPTRRTAHAFVHTGAERAAAMGEVAVDGTAWHNWAVEWTPTSITAYLDGAEWWTVEDPALLPTGPMHLCVQLDWFPTGEGAVQESSMQVDWVRQYAPPGAPTDGAGGEEVRGPRLSEGAPDAPARPGLVPGARPAERG